MKTLAEKIAIMQAALEGKKIRYTYADKTRSEWRLAKVAENLGWDWVLFDYEVVPEPEVLFVNKRRSTMLYSYRSAAAATASARGEEGNYEYIAKKFIEATDEGG